MGRETKILLGFLGLLAGVFVGVLSMKLFVPRPPDGAGPDIHADHEVAASQEVVDPPSLAPRAWDFAAAPPLVSDQASSQKAPAPDRSVPLTASPMPTEPTELPAAPHAEDPVADAALPREPSSPVAATDDLLPPPTESLASEPPASRFAVQPPEAPLQPDPFVSRATFEQPLAPAVRDTVMPPAPSSAIVAGAAYTVQAGDSWWSLAERAYGDGRLYRALFAWNRVLDPRVSLAAGTPLEVPPLPKLEAAWPKLMPTPGQ